MNYLNEQTKVPFYMSSPMQKLYQMEMEYEKDMERMKSLYPRQVQQLMPIIEDYCDGLEYEGSRIYDENPDALMMRRECEKLIQKIKDQPQKESENLVSAEVSHSNYAFNLPEGWELPSRCCAETAQNVQSDISVGPLQKQSGKPDDDVSPDDWKNCLIGVLFRDEIFRRRIRHRRCCRWW